MATTVDGRTTSITDRRYVEADRTEHWVWTDEHLTTGTIVPGPCFTVAEFEALVREQAAADKVLADLVRPAYFIRCEDGSYNLVEGGQVTWSIYRSTRRDDGDSHSPQRPWVVCRRFYSGHQVEARCATATAAKRFLLG